MILRRGGFRLWTCLTIGVLALACARPGERPASADRDTLAAARVDSVRARPAADATESSASYACGDEYRFVAQIQLGGRAVRLLLPDTTVTLPQAISASGARFSEAEYTYWSKGEEALLETPGGSFTGCVRDGGGPGWREAKARGADFRAIGQEPGWIVDIYEGDSIAVTADYGAARYRFPVADPEAGLGAGTTTYRIEAEGHRATIVIEDEACRDGMSGWPYEATVTMTLDDREYRGCGRRL